MPAPTNTANEIQSRTYGGQERVITYDEAGNVATLQAKDATDGWRYTYDYRNRLIKIESTEDITDNPVDWEEAPVALYYDGLNRRIKKDLTTGNDVVYLYDGWQCVEEREVDGGTWEMRRQYVYGGQYIDEPVLFDKDTDDDEEIDVSYWYLHDTNYNVVALADATGSTLERCWYEPYGPTTFTNASGTANTPATESDYANTLAFQGQRYDSESGLYYFRNRYYSPVLGRFAQRDPAGYADGMSLYEFLKTRPINQIDQFGSKAWETNPDAKWDSDTIAKVRDCIKCEIEEMIKNEEQADCADVAIAALIRCAAKYRLPLRFRYWDGVWKFYDSGSDAYGSVDQFERAMRSNLGAVNLFDNTTQVKDYHRLQKGDMLLYDLRFHGSDTYQGHTMPILETATPPEGETDWTYTVAEGHTTTTPGEGTAIESTPYTETQVRAKFPNEKARDSGPGLRDSGKRDAEGNRTWPLTQPGGREWKWSQFGSTR